jgi:hypothetical protein
MDCFASLAMTVVSRDEMRAGIDPDHFAGHVA